MTRSIAAVAVPCVAWLLTSGVAPSAQALQVPPATEIVNRHVQALGGADAYSQIQSMRARGSLEISGQAITGSLEILSARPALMRIRAELPGIGLIEAGYDGAIAWERSPVAGPTLLEGRRRTEAAESAEFDATLFGPDVIRQMRAVERAEFDERPALRVEVTLASGSERIDYFDVETGLLIGSEASRATPLGVVPVVTVLRDYQRFGSLLQPTVVVQRQLGLEQVARLTMFEYNVVPDNAFDLPAEIRALVP